MSYTDKVEEHRLEILNIHYTVSGFNWLIMSSCKVALCRKRSICERCSPMVTAIFVSAAHIWRYIYLWALLANGDTYICERCSPMVTQHFGWGSGGLPNGSQWCGTLWLSAISAAVLRKDSYSSPERVGAFRYLCWGTSAINQWSFWPILIKVVVLYMQMELPLFIYKNLK